MTQRRNRVARGPRRNHGRVQLERAISKLGIASRTQAREWILAGRVRVGARVEKNPLYLVVPESALILIDGKEEKLRAPVTIALNKPKNVVTTRSDEKGRPTVYAHLETLDEHVVPIGRLDFATTGLLLLTNDTRFATWVTDPENAVPRVYIATVRGEFTREKIARLEAGLIDAGEKLAANRIEIRKASKRETHLKITLLEGKNREIRRMLLGVGHEVTRLKRISFGGIELGTLTPGQTRRLSASELRNAFPGAPIRVEGIKAGFGFRE